MTGRSAKRPLPGWEVLAVGLQDDMVSAEGLRLDELVRVVIDPVEEEDDR